MAKYKRKNYTPYEFIEHDIRWFQPRTSDERVYFQETIASANRKGEITNAQAVELHHLLDSQHGPRGQHDGKPRPLLHTKKRRTAGRRRKHRYSNNPTLKGARCYACDSTKIAGLRDRRPEGGKIELACSRHASVSDTQRLA